MPFPAYNSDAIRLLSKALAQIMAETDQRRTGSELAAFRRAVTRALIEAYDDGERDPEALRRAGAKPLANNARWTGRDP